MRGRKAIENNYSKITEISGSERFTRWLEGSEGVKGVKGSEGFVVSLMNSLAHLVSCSNLVRFR